MQHLDYRTEFKRNRPLSIRIRNQEKFKLHSQIRQKASEKELSFPSSLISFKDRFSADCVDWDEKLDLAGTVLSNSLEP